MTAPSENPSLSVSVRGARLVYGGVPLFDGLDFDLEGGSWTCILGASGVGKTSLLRLIAGLGGSHESASVVASDGATVAGRAAYMAQQDLLLPWLGTLGNVTLGSRLRREPEATARARDLLDRVGIAHRADALPASLSGGERQRAALARTLMEDCPVVLMDEPFSSLDAITRHRLQALSAGLLAGRTVLLVTHDPLEALRLGHRVHVMRGQPATLDAPLEPAGMPPRDVHDPAILNMQADLLDRLAKAEAGS